MRKLAGAVLLVAALFVFLGPPKKHLPPEPSASTSEAGDLVATISNGERVDLARNLYPGRYTVVAFHAEW
ncbi:MAG: hypothetical protein L6R30_16830 [Thermoanaerobaculia bacterium]|nr:hypothetical protein [Thermoanaerobaculia bacterium]MCK6684069.1 hypothetical protein [Thermoanaerobaculia bacterium]